VRDRARIDEVQVSIDVYVAAGEPTSGAMGPEVEAQARALTVFMTCAGVRDYGLDE
jgi:hypothetical protein